MQDRLTYASGNTISTEGFRCAIGEPIDIIVDEDTPFSYNANIDTNKQMLVTLEVDGEVVCYRELHDFEIVNEDELAIVIGDYTINFDADELTGEYTSARIRLEPVELTVTDAFRAAVVKVAPSGGGSGGGGVLVVNLVYDEDTGKTAFDKTWKEVYDADSVLIIAKSESAKEAYIFKSMGNKFPSGKYVKVLNPESAGSTIEFLADSENGYPAAGL